MFLTLLNYIILVYLWNAKLQQLFFGVQPTLLKNKEEKIGENAIFTLLVINGNGTT